MAFTSDAMSTVAYELFALYLVISRQQVRWAVEQTILPRRHEKLVADTMVTGLMDVLMFVAVVGGLWGL